jgi:hypothetical protein
MIINKPKNNETRVRYVYELKVESNEMTYWFEKFKYDEVFISEFNYQGIEWKWKVYRMTHVKSGRVIEYNKCWDPEQNKVQIKKND